MPGMGRNLEYAVRIMKQYVWIDLANTTGLSAISASLELKADKSDLDAPVEKVQALGLQSGTVAISASSGNIVTLTAVGALTITLAAKVPSGYARVLTFITNGGNYSVTWPPSIPMDRWGCSHFKR